MTYIQTYIPEVYILALAGLLVDDVSYTKLYLIGVLRISGWCDRPHLYDRESQLPDPVRPHLYHRRSLPEASTQSVLSV